MGLASEIGAAGIPPAAAKFVFGSVNIAQTVAGTTQADATPIAAATVRVATASANQGVVFSGTEAEGDRRTVINKSGQTIKVYPATGETIGGVTVNLPVSLADDKAGIFIKMTGANWDVIIGDATDPA